MADITLDGLADRLQQMATRAGSIDLSRPLAVTAQLLVSDAKQCFATATDPNGGSWPPLKRPSKRRGGASAKPLRDTDRLMASITGQVQGNTASVGTNVSYAPFHQFGTKYIPPRRFLGVSAKTRTRIEGLVVKAVMTQLRGG